jgi:hypothetical protein
MTLTKVVLENGVCFLEVTERLIELLLVNANVSKRKQTISESILGQRLKERTNHQLETHWNGAKSIFSPRLCKTSSSASYSLP